MKLVNLTIGCKFKENGATAKNNICKKIPLLKTSSVICIFDSIPARSQLMRNLANLKVIMKFWVLGLFWITYCSRIW